MSPTTRRNAVTGGPETGFSLLELIVVLAIFGLILASLAGGLRTAVGIWQGQQRQIARDADIGSLQTMLAHLVESGWNFKGTADSVEFYGAMPRALGIPGSYQIKLRRVGGDLILEWTSALVDSPPPGTTGRATLIDAVTDLKLAYLYHADATSTAQWVSATANEDSATPALIQIRVAFDAGAGRRWPRLIVAPPIDPPQATATPSGPTQGAPGQPAPGQGTPAQGSSSQ